jgi:AraC-like DNA-binding protein
MNRVALLLRTPSVTLCEFDHPTAAAHLDPDYEVSPQHSISFVEDGTFDARVGSQSVRLGPGSLFVTTRGMEFSCRHAEEMPSDRCLTVAYDEHAVESLMLAGVRALEPPAARVSMRQHFLRHRLRSCTPGEEVRFELLAGALFESLTIGQPAPVRVTAHISPLVRRIDRAVQLIEAEYARTLTLGDLASAAGLSPYYFARAFRRVVGMPPHRYLTAVRLRHAARLLVNGAGVTRTCFDVGFGSLSHFITAFRKRFGVVPSAVQRGASLPTLRAALSAPVWVRTAP